MNQFLSTWNGLDLQRRIVLLGAIGLTFLAVLSLAQIATRPGMALLYSGLDPAAAGGGRRFARADEYRGRDTRRRNLCARKRA